MKFLMSRTHAHIVKPPIDDFLWTVLMSPCGGLEMAPHVNNWSPVDGALE